MKHTAYCVRCKTKVEVKHPKFHSARVSGLCSKCGGKVSVFVKTDKKQ